MSTFLQFFGASGGRLSYQKFTSSGKFVPSSALLARSGLVFVRVVSGATGGTNGGGSSNGTGILGSPGVNGRNGGVVEGFIALSEAVDVVVGAGGIAGQSSIALTLGGDSSFGSIYSPAYRVTETPLMNFLLNYGYFIASPTTGSANSGGVGGYIISPNREKIDSVKTNIGNRDGANGASAPNNTGICGCGGGGAGVMNGNTVSNYGGAGGAGGSGYVEVWWYE